MAYQLSQPNKIFILAVAKKLVAVAYSAKMAYFVSRCLLTYLPILGDSYTPFSASSVRSFWLNRQA